MAKLQPVRGTRDLLPADCRRHRAVTEAARAIAERYGFGEIETPVFEFTEVFARTLGETSDIVTKEMYTFTDRSGASITLRPENTAGVVRAAISEGLLQSLPLKLFYAGPMFRYERPQKGRLREFHQVGIELLGVAEPAGDVEAIALGAHILDALGLSDRTRLELNSLGDPESRARYREALVAHFAARRQALSPESRQRLERNPLRILDSKDERDREVLADAPTMSEYLSEAASAFFARVREGLERLGIAHVLNPRLVRGLDYYTHTAFEFTTSELGAQGAVLAGGRYDGLVEAMGGPAIAGVGWAAGVERLAMMLAEPAPAPRPVMLVPLDAGAELEALALAERLHRAGLVAELTYRGSLRKRLREADRRRAAAAVILGPDELAAGEATIRDLDTGEQRRVGLESVVEALAPYR